jgi:hypothetical protein
VRTYGLFAANVFGLHDFDRANNKPGAGDHTLKPGESLSFRYRVLLHQGDEKQAQIAKEYQRYAQIEKP